MRDEVFVRPAGGGLLLEAGQPDGPDGEAEREPRRLHNAAEVVAAPHRGADIAVVVGVMARRVPLDDLEGEPVRIFGKGPHRFEHALVRRGPARE